MYFLGWFLAFVKGVRAHYKRRWVLDASFDKAPDGLPVSIVIPARNEERGIGPCVLSALSQDHSNVEVIVLNDGSTDRTGEILSRDTTTVSTTQVTRIGRRIVARRAGLANRGHFSEPSAMRQEVGCCL